MRSRSPSPPPPLPPPYYFHFSPPPLTPPTAPPPVFSRAAYDAWIWLLGDTTAPISKLQQRQLFVTLKQFLKQFKHFVKKLKCVSIERQLLVAATSAAQSTDFGFFDV